MARYALAALAALTLALPLPACDDPGGTGYYVPPGQDTAATGPDATAAQDVPAADLPGPDAQPDVAAPDVDVPTIPDATPDADPPDATPDAAPDATPDADQPDAPSDPCAPDPCTTPPAPTCDGDVRITWTGPAACTANGAAAHCAWTPKTADCAASGATCSNGACVGGEAQVPGAGDLVITEIMFDPEAVSDSDGEWAEVLNVSAAPLDLEGCVLHDDHTDAHVIAAGGPLVVQPDARLVLAAGTSPLTNGGVQAAYAWQNITLSNDGDELAVTCADVLVDRVAWNEAEWPNVRAVSMTLDPAQTSPSANDAGSAWCVPASSYGQGDWGTPGAENEPCPPVDAVDWCRLEGPADSEVVLGQPFTLHVRLLEDGLTTQTAGTDFHPYIQTQLGFGPAGVDPSMADAEWIFFGGQAEQGWTEGADPGHDDHYGTFMAPSAGDWDLAWRVSADGGETWTLCDRDTGAPGQDGSEDGFQLGRAAHLTVLPDPCEPNPCTSPPAGTCQGDVLVHHPSPGTCSLAGSAPSCAYASTQVDCAAAGGSCSGGVCVGGAPAPAPGEVLITEVMQNPAAVTDDVGEWFEVASLAGGTVNLEGCVVDSLGDPSTPISTGGAVLLEPGGFAVLARSGDVATNGGIEADFAWPGNLTLSNASDRLALVCGGQVVDEISWDDGATFPDVSGASMQLDPGAFDATSNDDGAAWCVSPTEMPSGDNGTPGAANTPCGI